MVILISSLVVALSAADVMSDGAGREQAEPTITLFKPTTADDTPFKYEATVSVVPFSTAVGGTFTIRCEAFCKRETWMVYNGLLSEEYKLPAQIFIYSADGSTRHELLRNPTGGPKPCDPLCWAPIGGRTFGREILVKIGTSPSPDGALSRARDIDLKPGEYYVQAVYNHWVTAAPPSIASGAIIPQDNSPCEPQPHGGLSNAQMDKPMAVSLPMKFIVTSDKSVLQDRTLKSDCPLRLDLGRTTNRRAQSTPTWLTDTTIRITNQSDETLTVFNPTLDSTIFWGKHVANLAIISANGKYLGNCFDIELGRNRVPLQRDWVRFPSGGTILQVKSFRQDLVMSANYLRTAKTGLPAGKHLMELRGHQAFLAPRPAIVDETTDSEVIEADPGYRKWLSAFPGPEIARSNRIELEILPRTGN